jgi:hypothetical protein
MQFGIDFASAPPRPDVLRSQHVDFVCRYVSTVGNPKNITDLEVSRMRAAGIAIVLVFETTADRALAGQAAGVEDARAAAAQAAGVGLGGAPIYFAVDFDATVGQQDQINAYLRGAASVIGKARVGVYGGYWVVKRALDAKACRYAWQTYAWSGGFWDPRAHIRQYRNGATFAGITCDFDEAYKTDFGQTPAPRRRVVSVAARRRVLRAWILARHAHGVTWAALKKTARWKLWRHLGGK